MIDPARDIDALLYSELSPENDPTHPSGRKVAWLDDPAWEGKMRAAQDTGPNPDFPCGRHPALVPVPASDPVDRAYQQIVGLTYGVASINIPALRSVIASLISPAPEQPHV